MLDDILEFAATSLVDNGRLSFWMPTSNEEDEELVPPTHKCLSITSICTQPFNKCELPTTTAVRVADEDPGSRRLITYRRLPDAEVTETTVHERKHQRTGLRADDLNPFRRLYFKGFRP